MRGALNLESNNAGRILSDLNDRQTWWLNEDGQGREAGLLFLLVAYTY